jgi:hypothetical protein
MWVFHPEAGFLSVVRDPNKQSRLVVRARVRQDLENRFLSRLTGTVATPSRDYGYRGWCSPAEWGAAVASMATSVTYDNFKLEVLRRQGVAREQLYHRVWATMLNAEEELGFGEHAQSTTPATRPPWRRR